MGQCQCGHVDRKGLGELFVKATSLIDAPAFELEFDAHCRLGFGTGKRPFQDAFFAIGPPKLKKYHIFAVLDGFGPRYQAAHAVRNMLEAYFEEKADLISQSHSDLEVQSHLMNSVEYAEESLKAEGLDFSRDGTCLCLVLISKKKVYALNIGNCEAYLYRKDPNGKLKAIKLCRTHDLSNSSEKKRVKSAGANLSGSNLSKDYERVWSKENELGIRATRGLGGFKFKEFLISEPQTDMMNLEKEDIFIVLGTDGLWTVMGPEDVGNFIQDRERDGIAEDLVDEAFERWKIGLKGDKEPENKYKVVENGISDEPNVEGGADDITGAVIFL